MKKLSIYVLIMFLFIGCKAELKTVIYVSDLLTSRTRLIESDFKLEVTNCSQSEIKSLKEAIPNMLPRANFQACNEIGKKYFGLFKLPVQLTKERKSESIYFFNIGSSKNTLMYFTVSKELKKSINSGLESYKESQLKNPLLNDLKIDIVFNLKNDTSKPFRLASVPLFVNGTAAREGTYTLKSGGSAMFQLSDLDVELAINEGWVRVLLHPEK